MLLAMSTPSFAPDAAPRAVILCGGKGTRLRPYTTVLPKPLMPIGDRPILEIVLGNLAAAGVRRATLCVGHLGELIRSFFGDGSRWGLRIDYAMEDAPLGTIGPLAFVENLGDDFLVMNGDLLTDVDIPAMFAQHRAGGVDLTVATFEREVRIDFGVITANDADRIVGFHEKPTLKYEVSTGVYAMNRRVLEFVKPGVAFGFDQLVGAMLAAGRPIGRFAHRGVWLDIGRIDDYEAAQNDPRWGRP